MLGNAKNLKQMNNKLYICMGNIHCKGCIHAWVHFPFHKHLILKRGEPYRKYIWKFCNEENDNEKGTTCDGKCKEFTINE